MYWTDIGVDISYCHTLLHLGFSDKLRVWQVPACKMGPRSGMFFAPYAISPCSTRPDPTTRRVSLNMLGVPPSVSKTCLNIVRCTHSTLNFWPGDNCHGWSPTTPRMVTHTPWMVTYWKKIYYRLGIWHLDLTHKTKTRWQLPGLVT